MAYKAYGKRKRTFMKRRPMTRKKPMFRRSNYGGKAPGTASSKRNTPINDVAPTLVATKVLRSFNLCDVPHSDTNNINTRQRHLVNFRGFKLCMEVSNVEDVPIYFNVAMVTVKANTAPTAFEFFRGSGQNRALDFGGATVNGLEYHCLPLNADKFNILWHKRYTLNPGFSTTPTVYKSDSGKSFFTIKKYTKFNRQLQYANNADVIPESGGVWLIYWASVFGSSDVSPSLPNALSISTRVVAYYREPK